VSDKNSSPRYPSVEELRAIVPDTFTRPQDLIRVARTLECDLTKIRVCKSYLGIPLQIWEQFGSPMMVSPWFDGWDLVLVPGVGNRLAIRSCNFIRMPFHINTIWHAWLVPGSYEYRIEQDPKSGLTQLRVLDCNHACVDKAFRERWNAEHKKQRSCNHLRAR
jgi:hypothetical protein